MAFDLHWPPGHWPDYSGGSIHWPQNHWPNASGGVAPPSPGGAGAFELALDEATVRYAWITGVEKHHDGKERRSNVIDDPATRYEGSALLLGPQASRGDQVRAVRTRLARFASLGVPFLLGLTYEALAIRADSTVSTVYVFAGALAQADWAVPGVRVIVRHGTYGSAQAVIQSVTSDTIEVLKDDGSDLGDPGRLGGSIMPAASVFLDAQQSFDRYQPQEPIERWAIKARNADGGFRSAATSASTALSGIDAIFAGLAVSVRTPGTDGNGWQVIVTTGASTGTGELSEDADNKIVTVKVQYDTTTVADVITLLHSAAYVSLDGSPPDDTEVITSSNGGDVITAGGADSEAIEVGLTATLAEYRDRPVWDRPPVADGAVADSIQSMNDPQDMGGLPFTAQTASVPDWGRTVRMDAPMGDEWQWAKKALWTIGGSWRSFWFSTFRRDLLAVSVSTGTLTVTDGESSGDVRTWYPQHRKDLAVRVAGVTQYVRIASATDNGDGTTTLALVDESDAPVTLGGLPTRVSWLELCRFEADEVAVTFTKKSFAFSMQARVIQEVTG